MSVAGENVSLLVIDKVPFPHPKDPVVAKLSEKAGKGWFSEVSLPRARTTSRQGTGRLLRTASDRGVIAILDPRASSKRWGRGVIRSLPPTPTTSDILDVERFFRAFNAA